MVDSFFNKLSQLISYNDLGTVEVFIYTLSKLALVIFLLLKKISHALCFIIFYIEIIYEKSNTLKILNIKSHRFFLILLIFIFCKKFVKYLYMMAVVLFAFSLMNFLHFIAKFALIINLFYVFQNLRILLFNLTLFHAIILLFGFIMFLLTLVMQLRHEMLT